MFSVLGIKETCTNDEVKAAYFKLAKQWHPDVNSNPSSSAKFKQISNAYEVLKTDQSRAEYMARLQQRSYGSGSYQTSSWSSQNSDAQYEGSHTGKWNATRKFMIHTHGCVCMA